jgi:hypothetical protein
MYKISKRNGSLGHERLTIKGFKFSDQLDQFLNKQYDNSWSKVKAGSPLMDLKPGTYAFIGQKWVNVKEIDIFTLPHV